MSKKQFYNKDKKLWTYHQTVNRVHLKAGHSRQEKIYKEIIKSSSSGKILEIGFGDGYLLKKLSKKFVCTGADISEKNVKQIRNKIKNVSFDTINVDGVLPYGDNEFDYFIASEVLEHMSDDELRINVNEIHRVLKLGGTAIVTVPAQEKFEDNACFCPNCNHIFHKWGHKQVFDDKRIDELFKMFQIVQKEIFFVHVGNSVIEKIISKFLCKVRSILVYFVDIPNKSYMIILRNK